MKTRYCQFGNPIPKERGNSGKPLPEKTYLERKRCADPECNCRTPGLAAKAWHDRQEEAINRFIYSR